MIFILGWVGIGFLSVLLHCYFYGELLIQDLMYSFLGPLITIVLVCDAIGDLLNKRNITPETVLWKRKDD